MFYNMYWPWHYGNILGLIQKLGHFQMNKINRGNHGNYCYTLRELLTQQNQPIEPVEVETSFYPVFVGSPNHWKFLSHIEGTSYGIAILARSNNGSLGVRGVQSWHFCQKVNVENNNIKAFNIDAICHILSFCNATLLLTMVTILVAMETRWNHSKTLL